MTQYKELLSHSVADFKVMVLCRELIYVNTFLGLDLCLKAQTSEQVLDICENMAPIDVCCFSWLQRNG